MAPSSSALCSRPTTGEISFSTFQNRVWCIPLIVFPFLTSTPTIFSRRRSSLDLRKGVSRMQLMKPRRPLETIPELISRQTLSSPPVPPVPPDPPDSWPQPSPRSLLAHSDYPPPPEPTVLLSELSFPFTGETIHHGRSILLHIALLDLAAMMMSTSVAKLHHRRLSPESTTDLNGTRSGWILCTPPMEEIKSTIYRLVEIGCIVPLLESGRSPVLYAGIPKVTLESDHLEILRPYRDDPIDASKACVAEAKGNTRATKYSDSRCTDKVPTNPPPSHYPQKSPAPPKKRYAVRSNSTKGKGP
ncbi:hypothetical protein AALP_AA8G084300 [Arabis alpina]|uniref:Uncharacterized protein n=1 Tax=Arabis alpina TaxID=50452 RepID=A0A087G5S8_ARAAL|nr:hypothetical protein AALP_AA8G084300 [Arabis alpina]